MDTSKNVQYIEIIRRQVRAAGKPSDEPLRKGETQSPTVVAGVEAMILLGEEGGFADRTGRSETELWP